MGRGICSHQKKNPEKSYDAHKLISSPAHQLIYQTDLPREIDASYSEAYLTGVYPVKLTPVTAKRI